MKKKIKVSEIAQIILNVWQAVVLLFLCFIYLMTTFVFVKNQLVFPITNDFLWKGILYFFIFTNVFPALLCLLIDTFRNFKGKDPFFLP